MLPPSTCLEPRSGKVNMLGVPHMPKTNILAIGSCPCCVICLPLNHVIRSLITLFYSSVTVYICSVALMDVTSSLRSVVSSRFMSFVIPARNRLGQ